MTAALLLLASLLPGDTPLVYLRTPVASLAFPDADSPGRISGDTDLMYRHADGTEEVLVDVSPTEAVCDPCPSLNGAAVYYAKFSNTTKQNYFTTGTADIYRLDLATRTTVQVTHSEKEFPAGAVSLTWWRSRNLAPCEVPTDTPGKTRLLFVSNRNGLARPASDVSQRWGGSEASYCHQLWAVPIDASQPGFVTVGTPEQVGYMNQSGAAHPFLLRDGGIAWSSREDQGVRDTRAWALFRSEPDGRHFSPLMSALNIMAIYHFACETADGLACVEYYTQNDFGFGSLVRFDFPGSAGPTVPPFGSPTPIAVGLSPGNKFSFAPPGLVSLTPWTHGRYDVAAPLVNGQRVGKVSYPATLPGGDLLLVWSGYSACKVLGTPAPNFGVYRTSGSTATSGPAAFIKVVDTAEYHEWQPRAMLPWSEIYGAAPVARPWLPDAAGRDYGWVGSSTCMFPHRDSSPGTPASTLLTYFGYDVFNRPAWNGDGGSTNLVAQGGDLANNRIGPWSRGNSRVEAVRIVKQQARYWGTPVANLSGERLSVLGEIPLRKFDAAGQPILDPDGNPDTSFVARIPADTSFTFQLLDAEGVAIVTSQTWHHLRPGEVRTDCGGCHAHAHTPLAFEDTEAGKRGVSVNLTAPAKQTVWADVAAILNANCTSCHSGATAAGRLQLDDADTYSRLTNDVNGGYGYPPMAGKWFRPNASRWVRMLNSARSLLAWKVAGRRLDDWSNNTWPTEAVPGDPTTLPAGVDKRMCDLDYVDGGCKASAIPDESKRAIYTWIDTGCQK